MRKFKIKRGPQIQCARWVDHQLLLQRKLAGEPSMRMHQIHNKYDKLKI